MIYTRRKNRCHSTSYFLITATSSRRPFAPVPKVTAVKRFGFYTLIAKVSHMNLTFLWHCASSHYKRLVINWKCFWFISQIFWCGSCISAIGGLVGFVAGVTWKIWFTVRGYQESVPAVIADFSFTFILICVTVIVIGICVTCYFCCQVCTCCDSIPRSQVRPSVLS